jgi:hypothetical protein
MKPIKRVLSTFCLALMGLLICYQPVFSQDKSIRDSEFNFLTIKAKENVLLSRKGKPISTNDPIWHEGAVNPAAFLVKQQTPAQLVLTLHVPEGQVGEDYLLEGYLENETILFAGNAAISKDGSNNIDFLVSAQNTPEEVTHITGKQMNWRITPKSTGRTVALENVDLDLYWLFDAEDSFFLKGIPVEVLPIIAAASPTLANQQSTQHEQDNERMPNTDKSAARPTISTIASTLFKTNPPRYDIWNGNWFYITFTTFDNITLLLNKYVWDVNNRNTRSYINCYDMAALLQYVLKFNNYSDAKFAYMEPFGYLKATNLIGRGYCNNPFYGKGGSAYIYPTNPMRKAFGRHAFVQFNTSKKIADACAGPHTGNENPAQYVAAAVDNVYPSNAIGRPGKASDIRLYRGVTTPNILTSARSYRQNTETSAFAKQVGISSNASKDRLYPEDMGQGLNIEEMQKDGNVVCAWPDPRECPVLRKEGWEVNYEEIIAGAEEVLKIWSLEKDNESIRINLYASSQGYQIAKNRFLSLGSWTTMAKNPYTKGPSFLGEHSAKFVMKGRSHYLWVFKNVVFDVETTNASFNVPTFLKWLNKLAMENVKYDISNRLPSTDAVSCLDTIVRVGENATVEVKTPDDIQFDIISRGGGLRLIDEKDGSLTFRAKKESENDLTLITVDKNTLLTNSKTCSVKVKE